MGEMGLMWIWWGPNMLRRVRGGAYVKPCHWFTPAFRNIRQNLFSRVGMSFGREFMRPFARAGMLRC